jgi:zinc D-Ala-D-Ala carboxypeptidase
MDDIPEALREQTQPKKSFSPTKKNPRRQPKIFKFRLFFLLSSLALLLGLLASYLLYPSPQKLSPRSTIEPNTTAIPSTLEPNTENALGHLKYAEAPLSELKSIVADGSIKMRTAAANKFLQMQAAARKQGINLYPISGFRSISQQDEIFFREKERRGQSASKRAEVSAPPGYSEHHTGYAVDIGDANVPATNLSTTFEQTRAFRWLQQNAPRYSFELSFPKDNLQGISYEPWHWRFVGDIDSLETFYKARNLKQPLSNEP